MSAVDFILDNMFDDLPEATVHEAIRCLVNTLGVGVAASQIPLSRTIHNHATRQFGGTGATLWQNGRRVNAAGAALANGMTIDALDAHDGMKLTKGHMGCGIFPALIAVMQAEGINNPKEFVTSIVIGYEIGTRAGVALHASAFDYHTSGAWIVLATAAITARQLKLTKAQTREAIGIAEYHGPRSQMMRVIDAPTMVKDGSGWGAMAGVSAAYLAQDGFTGAPAITVEDPDLAGFWGDLGQNWHIEQQYIKLYPVCRWAQPAAEGALPLMRDHDVRADQISKINVETFHEAKRLATIPTTTEQAQYSLPFPVAAAVVRGTVGVAEVTADGLTDPQIIALAKMVEISEDDTFNAAFPARRFARTHFLLTDGRILSSDVTEAQGDPEAKLDDHVVWNKFRSLTVPVMGAEWSETFLKTARTIADAPSVAPMFDLMAQPPK